MIEEVSEYFLSGRWNYFDSELDGAAALKMLEESYKEFKRNRDEKALKKKRGKATREAKEALSNK